jgi:hypothetical protein
MHYAHYDNGPKSMLETLIHLLRLFAVTMKEQLMAEVTVRWSTNYSKDRNSPFWLDTNVYPTDEVRGGNV